MTISPKTGNLVAAVTESQETGFASGYSSLWRHEQLALTMVTADKPDLTESGEIAVPSADISTYNDNLILVGGMARNMFITVTLPKGYRFTGYKLVLRDDLRSNPDVTVTKNNTAHMLDASSVLRFYETEAWEEGVNMDQGDQVLTDYNAVATSDTDGDIAIDGTTGETFTIERTSLTEDDMSNQLYFRMTRTAEYYGVTIQSFEIFFTAEGTFTANVQPTSTNSTAVSMVKSGFNTSKIDIGELTAHTKDGATYYSFDYEEVKDLIAYNYLYQDDAVEDGAPADVATTKNIYEMQVNGNYYYGLKNDTYFVETPVEITNSSNNEVPIGYRIVGAFINYAYADGTTPEEYTINVYDRTGKTVQKTITVNSSNASGSYDLGLMNNDAVKFAIDGVDTGVALVTIDLMLQALDPYIDKMDIVCSDGNELSLTESFTADDFSVSGGVFEFYVPEKYKDVDLTFTFSDLYSKYGDETYYDGTGHGAGRYSYVTSEYFVPIDGDGDNGLYDSAYSPDADYTTKVYTSVAGDKAFKFNNAEDLSNTGSGTASALEEYPFSVATYTAAVADGGTGGSFVKVVLNASGKDTDEIKSSGTYYVFTADETRWNIAPTTSWQHRYYAYYTMVINLKAKTFDPVLTWTKIYDNTLYKDNGTVATNSMWGLTLGTIDHDTQESMKGYLMTDEIQTAIAAEIADENIETPDTATQILYIDASNLSSVISTSTTTLENLKDSLATNALFYLPQSTTSTLDNVAYMTTSGTFRAGKNIVLTDMNPFYALYDIQVDAANYASYKRQITKDSYGKVQNASLIMPFIVAVTDGTHTNIDGSTFSLHYMQESAALTQIGGTTYAYFPELVDVTTSTANTPYLVQLTENSSEDGISFVVTQKGTLIKATTTMDEADYTFTGETSTGTATIDETEATYTFTSKGTYAGAQIAKEENVFYFAKNQFYNSGDLVSSYSYANIAPFRAYFTSASSSTTAKLSAFDIIFGEGQGDVPTGIQAVDASQFIDVNAPVYDMQGRMVSPTYRELGSKNLQKGFYVVNGVKFIVK
ncbi:MAG: hypothetical protein K6C10_03900 [Prevotella sp.]|nr:hypothetical protein [Prevotella sp.]